MEKGAGTTVDGGALAAVAGALFVYLFTIQLMLYLNIQLYR